MNLEAIRRTGAWANAQELSDSGAQSAQARNTSACRVPG
jgi:hypothetical protein